jgi:hypothetical protein
MMITESEISNAIHTMPTPTTPIKMKDPRTVIVSARTMTTALTKTEAASALTEVADVDPSITPVAKAAELAAIGTILQDIRKAEADMGSDSIVLSTPHNARASRLQSLVATGEFGGLEPLRAGGLEAKFDTQDYLGWATVAWAMLKHPLKCPIKRPSGRTAIPIPDTLRLAVIGDWGTGLYGAPKMAETINQDRDGFGIVMHLGDVYYSGTRQEVQSRFLNGWPKVPGAINLALNSNHEMYSGGDGYFNLTLPSFGQDSSYFAFQNRYWTFIGLDTAYGNDRDLYGNVVPLNSHYDHDVDAQQVAWLKGVLAESGERKVVLFSHHQLYSHFESQGVRLMKNADFNSVLTSGRIFAWYWGHEHRCTIFEGQDSKYGIRGRCIGHGGMPQNRLATRSLPLAGGTIWGGAEWRRSATTQRENNSLPPCVVLDGRNDYIIGEEDKFSPHGYAVLTVDGPHLFEEVMNPTGTVIYKNQLA